MTLPDEQQPPRQPPAEGDAANAPEPPPTTPEDAPAEAAQAAGADTSAGEPAPPVDLGPRTGGDQQSPPSTVAPDAATVPSVEPAAAEAPQAPKPAEQKVAQDAPPSQTGTPPAEQSAAAAEAKPAPAAKAAPAAKKAAAKEAEPKEAPRVPPPPGSINEILAAATPGVEIKAYMVPDIGGESVAVDVPREALVQVITAARDDAKLDLKYLRCLSGIDWQEDGLEVAYHLSSFTTPHRLTVKTRVQYDDPTVPSIAALYPAADWHERETRDMFGIVFDGHPDLVPLLLPEDMLDHFPLRKDNPLQEIEEWQGENLREGAGEGEE